MYLFFNFPLFIFINEVQGKAFVIHLSFGDRNGFYIDYFSMVNMSQMCICLGPRGHRVIKLPNFRLKRTNLKELKKAK